MHGITLGEVIGEGSYSTVRVVEKWHSRPCRDLAVKIIDRRKASRDFVKRFLPRELRILRQIDHPNIVTVHYIWDLSDVVYIYMDLAIGVLLELIRDEGAQPEPRAKWYFRQLLSALEYLHSVEIAHRDLKCENILLFPNNILKLSDFGFARKCCNDDGNRILSETFCGSAAYAAPEVLSSTPYNPKMYDIWSLGCVLFIMLTATMPFNDTNMRKMMQAQNERNFSFPSRVLLSEDSKSLVRRMLEPDVTRRAPLSQVRNHPWLKATPVVNPCQPILQERLPAGIIPESCT